MEWQEEGRRSQKREGRERKKAEREQRHVHIEPCTPCSQQHNRQMWEQPVPTVVTG